MDFDSFVKELTINLINNDKKCLNLLENNKNLVEVELSKDSNPKTINQFVTEFNNTILQNKKKKFKLHEEILKHNSLQYVYSVFRKSDILVKACKFGNEKAAEWLQTMHIDPYVQDEEGKTALMYAVQNSKPICVIESYGTDFKGLNMQDKNGNNVLFYSVYAKSKVMPYLRNADINHINYNGDTIIHYCCKNYLYDHIGTIFEIFENIDLNIPDNNGKTAAIYFIEKNYTLFNCLNLTQKRSVLNYINDNGESVLSYIIHKIYCSNFRPNYCLEYSDSIVCLLKAGVDFNAVVDEDGNTALMAFLLAGDYETFHFVTKYSHNLDFKKMNKYGESVTSLILKLNVLYYYNCSKPKEYKFSDANDEFIESKNIPLLYSFNYKYVDPVTKNTALMLATINCPGLIKHIIKNSYSSINYVNIHQENALILAAKINRNDFYSQLLKTDININQQDDSGNTALHYAVRNINIPFIYNLIINGANPYIENNEGETALKIAEGIENNNALKAIYGTLSSSELDDEMKALNEVQAEIQYQYINEYIEIGKSVNYRVLTKDDQDVHRTIYNSITYNIDSNFRSVTIGGSRNSDFHDFRSDLINYKEELPLLTLFNY